MLAFTRLQVPHVAGEGDRGKGLAGRQGERARQREDRLARQRFNRPRVSETVLSLRWSLLLLTAACVDPFLFLRRDGAGQSASHAYCIAVLVRPVRGLERGRG